MPHKACPISCVIPFQAHCFLDQISIPGSLMHMDKKVLSAMSRSIKVNKIQIGHTQICDIYGMHVTYTQICYSQSLSNQQLWFSYCDSCLITYGFPCYFSATKEFHSSSIMTLFQSNQYVKIKCKIQQHHLTLFNRRISLTLLFNK